MKILIVPDKFKGSLTASQVCDAIASAFTEKHPDWLIEKFPMADGGEGTCELLTLLSGGRKINATARDPLFRDVETFFGLSPDGRTAFVEMASASGLQRLNPKERNPRLTSSIGTGDLIAQALKLGAKTFVLGCGGSATNDAGIGMVSALGFLFLDSAGCNVEPIGDNLLRIESINAEGAMKEISESKFLLLTDVDNPLYGSRGAAFTFASQKGASAHDIEHLDHGLRHFAKILESRQPGLTDFPGAGAAGGLPVSARFFLNAEIKHGIDFIMDFAGLEEKIRQADWVITGEGKFDQQSLHGKVISGVAKLCQRYQKRLWLVCGTSEVSDHHAMEIGIAKILAIASRALNHEDAMNRAADLIRLEIRKSWLH